MIYAEASQISASHLQLILHYPDGRITKPVTVPKGEELRRVYFYNRLYIAETLTKWLNHRINVLEHVDGDTKQAETLIDQIKIYRKTSLRQLCRLVVEAEGVIILYAPGTASRYRATYEKLIP